MTEKSIATTSDGKVFIRIGDQCQPARSEDLVHLAIEKDAFQWKTKNEFTKWHKKNKTKIKRR